MNLTLTRPRSRVATLSPLTLATPEASPRRVGEGLGACPELAEGVRALFQWKFMGPTRVHVMLGSWNPEP